MAFFSKKIGGKGKGTAVNAQPSSHRFNYYHPSVSRVEGVPLQDKTSEHEDPSTVRIDAGTLIGASALESAVHKGSHLRSDVFSELSKSMAVIESKFHAGMYDAQAMPLVEALLDELHELASIQVERGAINDCRINDIKRANKEAYEAVYEARCRREMGLDAARLASLDYSTPDYEEIIARTEERKARKEAKRAAKNAAADERREARREKRSEGRMKRDEWVSKARERREAKSRQRIERRQEAFLQKQQAKMERIADKQRIARQEAQDKLDELRRAEEAREAKSRITQAQAEASIEQAKALAQTAKAETEKAKLEELQIIEAQKEYEPDVETLEAQGEPDRAIAEDEGPDHAAGDAQPEETQGESQEESMQDAVPGDETETNTDDRASCLPATCHREADGTTPEDD